MADANKCPLCGSALRKRRGLKLRGHVVAVNGKRSFTASPQGVKILKAIMDNPQGITPDQAGKLLYHGKRKPKGPPKRIAAMVIHYLRRQLEPDYEIPSAYKTGLYTLKEIQNDH